MSTPCTLSERAGELGSPQTGSQPHCRQVRLPAGKGRAQPCQKPGKLPFPREAAGQYDSKSYFTVAKERHVSRESQRGSAAGSRLQVPGTVRPEPPALPKTLPHLLPRRDPGPRPPSSQKDPPHTGTGWEPGPHPDPSAGSRAGSPPSHALKASSRAKQETLLLLFLPLAPCASSPWTLVLQPSGRRDAPVVPMAPAEE